MFKLQANRIGGERFVEREVEREKVGRRIVVGVQRSGKLLGENIDEFVETAKTDFIGSLVGGQAQQRTAGCRGQSLAALVNAQRRNPGKPETRAGPDASRIFIGPVDNTGASFRLSGWPDHFQALYHPAAGHSDSDPGLLQFGSGLLAEQEVRR